MTASATQRVRNARGHGVRLGEQIVDTALEVVDQAGLGELTLRGIARALGISAPAIYAHFASLDAVVHAVAQRCFADLAEHLDNAAQAAPPTRRLRAVGRAYLEYAELHRGRYLLMFGGQWDAAAAVSRGAIEADAAAALGRDALRTFTTASRSRRPARTDGEADAAAVVTWTTLHGFAHQRLLAGVFPWPADITDRVLDVATGRARS